MKEEWLFSNAVVPVDVETTAALVAEIKRLIDVVGGLVLKQALAAPVQEPVAWDRPIIYTPPHMAPPAASVQKRPPNCGTGHCSCVECVMEPAPVQMAHIVGEIDHTGKVWAPAQPAVPDAFGTREGEHPQYVQGWNDCRAEMLKGMK